jgi:hypothetical protein
MTTITLDAVANHARTVTHIAEFLVELQGKATGLTQRFAAVERGYFTPTEDDELRGLLVSYWHTRSALFDLLVELGYDSNSRIAYPDQSELTSRMTFLTALATAVVLVDAGRFLREIVDGNPLIRSKLNEPDASLGIEAGSYDKVQKSLFKTKHAWHLYHAIHFFEQHRDEISAQATDDPFQTCLTIVDRLWHRMEVSISQFTQAKLRSRGARLLRSVTNQLFGRAMYGLQKFGGIVVADKYLRIGHKPGLPAHIEDELLPLLQPGDVLVVRKEYALTTYFLPGYWPHAALYLGSTKDLEELGLASCPQFSSRWDEFSSSESSRDQFVLEGMKDGVCIRPMSSPFGSDSIVALRPCLDKPQIAQSLSRGMTHHGKPYDFDFDFRRSDRLVCTEVVYRSYDGTDGLTIPLKQRMGRPTLSGSDVIELGAEQEVFRPIAVYAPNLVDEGLIVGEKCVDVLRAGLEQ